MQILGQTTDGKNFIVIVSTEEWEQLKSGIKPDDYDTLVQRYNDFAHTEAGRFFMTYPGLRGVGHFRYLCCYVGKLQGTLAEVERVAAGEIHIPSIGPVGRMKIKQALEEYYLWHPQSS